MVGMQNIASLRTTVRGEIKKFVNCYLVAEMYGRLIKYRFTTGKAFPVI